MCTRCSAMQCSAGFPTSIKHHLNHLNHLHASHVSMPVCLFIACRAIKMRRAQGKDPFLAVDVTCAAPYLNVVQKFCKAGDIYLDVADDEFFNSSSKMLAACADATVGHAAGQSAQAVQSTQVVSR